MPRLPLRGPRPIDSRGRLTLPSTALDALGIPDGGFVEIDSREGVVILRAVEWTKRPARPKG